MSIRAFLAIDLNASIREALDQFQVQAQSILPVKWVEPYSMHLTVKFLGDIQEGQVATIYDVLRDVVKDTVPFSLTIKGLGGFPSLQRPRILWAGVTGNVDHLEVLVAGTESALNTLGYAPEGRAYHPHLTLSRVKSNSKEIGNILETSELLTKEWVFGELLVNRLSLFHSRLTPQGAVYSVLWELPLEQS